MQMTGGCVKWSVIRRIWLEKVWITSLQPHWVNTIFTIFLGKVTDNLRFVCLILFILVLFVEHFIHFLIRSTHHFSLTTTSYSKMKSYSLTSSWQDLRTGCRRYSRAARLRSWRRISITYTCRLPNKIPRTERSFFPPTLFFFQ